MSPWLALTHNLPASTFQAGQDLRPHTGSETLQPSPLLLFADICCRNLVKHME